MALGEWSYGVQGLCDRQTNIQHTSSETQRLQREEQKNHHVWWISFGQSGPTCAMHAYSSALVKPLLSAFAGDICACTQRICVTVKLHAARWADFPHA